MQLIHYTGSRNLPGFFIDIVTLLLLISYFTLLYFTLLYFHLSKGKGGLILLTLSKLPEVLLWYSRVNHFSSGVKAQARACG